MSGYELARTTGHLVHLTPRMLLPLLFLLACVSHPHVSFSPDNTREKERLRRTANFYPNCWFAICRTSSHRLELR